MDVGLLETEFILGMDRAMVTTGIEVAYRETINYLAERNDQRAETFGEDFLAKVVQVSVQVPRPAEDAMETLLEVVMQPRTEKPPTGNNAEESRPSAEQSEATVAGSGAPAAKVGDESGGAHLETAGGLRSTSTPEPMRPPIAHQPGQLERRLPKLDKQLLRAASEVIGSMDPNPRLLKRFANAYRLQLHVATLMDHEEVDLRPSQLVAFAKWVLIRLQWPALAVSLDADADGELLASLEERSGHKGATRPKGGPRAQNKPAPAWTKWLEDARLNDLLQLGGEPARISNLPDEVLLRVY